MNATPRLALALGLGLVLAACGGDEPAAPGGGGGAGGGGGGGGGGPPALGHQMPEFTPSGIKEDFKKFNEMKSAWKNARKEDEKTAADQALHQFVADTIAKWGAREGGVPAPEAHYYATILKEGDKKVEAIVQFRRYLDIGDPTSGNYLTCTTNIIGLMAETGDYDGAMAELKKSKDTTFKDKDGDRQRAETSIAVAMLTAGLVERAAPLFEALATDGMGDPESALYAVDCYQRLGRNDEAHRMAQKAADFYREGRQADRMKVLLAATSMLGRTAPDFTGARNWSGIGGPVTRDMMKGKVVVVFSWNMQVQWAKWFFERINALAEEYMPKEVMFVGISRFAKIDANKMITVADMTEETEMTFYEAWTREFKVTYPLAIGPYGDEGQPFMDAWAGSIIPAITVVGKDGKVFYVRTGKNPEHMAALKEMIEKAVNK